MSNLGEIFTEKDHFCVIKVTYPTTPLHELKRRLLLGRKAMTNIDMVLKSKDITLLTFI